MFEMCNSVVNAPNIHIAQNIKRVTNSYRPITSIMTTIEAYLMGCFTLGESHFADFLW